MIIQEASRLSTVKEYYFSIKLAEVREMISKGKQVLNLGIGSPDMKPSDATIDKLQAVAAAPDAHGYQSYAGIPALKSAISNYLQDVYEVSLAPKEILPLMGSKEAITHISLSFLDPGDKVLVPELGYPAYRAVAQMAQAKVQRFPMDENNNWEPDWQFLEDIEPGSVKLLWLNYPHMPTGTQGSLELLEKFVGLAKRKRFLLCHDNPYSRILNDQPLSIFQVAGAKKVAIELNSLSKSHNMAGWRVGWLAGDEEYVQTILKIKSNVDSGMFKGIQLAAIEALSNSKKWHDERNAVYKTRRDVVFRLFDKLGCVYDRDQVGLFVWARVPKNVHSATQLVDDLLYRKHIFVTPGSIFGPKGNKYLRISLCSPVETYEEALARLDSWPT